MKRIELTTSWIEGWHPSSNTNVADRKVAGLMLRGGPSGTKVFFRWANDSVRNEKGRLKRTRVTLGRWPALSLVDARAAVAGAKEAKATEAAGADLTVAQLAEAYRRDILSHREPGSAAWSWGIIRTHVLPALGERLARDVAAPEIAATVRAAKVERTVEVKDAKGRTVSRHFGGAAVARATLREVKAIFANAVGAGSLKASPAAVLQGKALGLKGTKRARWLNAEELAALFAALDLSALLDGTAKEQKLSETVRLAIALLYYVPVRSHSLIAAEWKEIDLDAARWTIPVSKLKLHRDDRAEARPFTVPLPETAVLILRKLQALAAGSRWVLASPLNPKRHIAPKALVRALARLQESGRLAAGSRFTVHDARRTWRAWAGDLGVSFEVAEKSLAHVLPGVAETYARADMVDARAQAADLVAAAMDRTRLGEAAPVVPLRERQA